MPNARGLRLREALDEFIRGFAGDTGSRRAGGINRRINDADRQLVESAQGLLGLLDGGSGSTAPEQRNTPGSRARDRAMPGSSEGSTGDRARSMWPGATEPAAPTGDQGGVSS